MRPDRNEFSLSLLSSLRFSSLKNGEKREETGLPLAFPRMRPVNYPPDKSNLICIHSQRARSAPIRSSWVLDAPPPPSPAISSKYVRGRIFAVGVWPGRPAERSTIRAYNWTDESAGEGYCEANPVPGKEGKESNKRVVRRKPRRSPCGILARACTTCDHRARV